MVTDDVKSDTVSSQEHGDSVPIHSGNVVHSSVVAVPHVAEEGTETKEGTKEAVSTKSHHKGKDPNNKKSSMKSSNGVSKNTDAKTSLTGKDKPRDDEVTTVNDDRSDAARMKNKNLTPRGKGGEKRHISNHNAVLPSISDAASLNEEDPEVAKVMVDLDTQEKQRAEEKVVPSEQELQLVNARKEKPKKQIKNISIVKQDEERVNDKEDLKKVSKTSHGVSRNKIAKTSLSKKASPRDAKASNHVRTVVNSIKIDKIIPQNKEGKRVPIPDREVVHRSVQDEEEPEVKKGVTDEVDAEEEDGTGLAEKKPVEQGLQTINVRKDEAQTENKKMRDVSIVSKDEENLVKAKEGKKQVVNSKIYYQKETIPSHKQSSQATLRSEKETIDAKTFCAEEENQKTRHEEKGLQDQMKSNSKTLAGNENTDSKTSLNKTRTSIHAKTQQDVKTVTDNTSNSGGVKRNTIPKDKVEKRLQRAKDEEKHIKVIEDTKEMTKIKNSHRKENIPQGQKKTARISLDENKHTDPKATLKKPSTFHDDKTLNEEAEVNEDANNYGRMKTENNIPCDEEDGESFPKAETVLSSVPVEVPHSNVDVANGVTDERDAHEKKQSELGKEEPAPAKQKLQKIKVKKDTERIKTNELSLNSPVPEEESEVEKGMITDVDTEEEESEVEKGMTTDVDTEEEESEVEKGMTTDVDTEEEEESMLTEELVEQEPQKKINIRKDKPKEGVKTRPDVVMVTQSDEEQDVDGRTMVANSKKPHYKEKTALDKRASKQTPHGGNKDTKVSFERKKKSQGDEKQSEKKLPLTDKPPGVADSKINRKKREKIIPLDKADSDDAEKRERAELAKEELERAEHALQIIKLRKELMDAIVVRNLKRLVAATQLVRDKNYQSAMMDEMMKARSLIARLQHIRKLWHAVLELDHNTVAEVKGYAAPPPAVSKVLSATLLILGHYVEETKEWPKVQNILNKTGKQSLLQRVARFDINEVDPGIAMGAKEILKDLTLDQVRLVSAGAATFYVWTKGLINEIETRLGEDILNTRPRTRRPRRTWGLSRPLAKFNKLSTLISVDL